MAVSAWNTTATLNKTVGEVNIDEGCSPAGINDALRSIMAEARTKFNETDAVLATGTVAAAIGTRIYATKAALSADLTPADGLYALVTDDPTASLNGLYKKSGATGTGTWGGPSSLFSGAAAAFVAPQVASAQAAAVDASSYAASAGVYAASASGFANAATTTYNNMRATIAADIDEATKGDQGIPGINGGTASNLTIGLFTGAHGQSLGPVLTSPEIVFTSGYRTIGVGAARYKKSAAVDASFRTANQNWTFISAEGVGYMLSDEPEVTFEQFGAYGNYGTYAAIPTGTDDYPQWLQAKAFLDYHIETHNNAYYKSVPRFRFGRKKYRFSQAINLDQGSYDIRGTGPHAVDRGGNTQLYFESGQCGFIFQSWDTTGVSGTTTNTPKGTGYSYIADIGVYASGGTLGAEEHGFLIKAPVIIERCFAYNFGGCGFRINADVGTGGNANCGKLANCGALYNGRSGLKITGGDSNAWEVYGFNGTNNLGFAIHDEPYLCTHYFGGHTSGNGARIGPFWAVTKPYAGCSSGGYRYVVIPGQETWASTNAPTGAATSNQGWLYIGAGGVDSTFHPAWVSGINLLAGGAVLVIGVNSKTFVPCIYMEGDQFQGFCYANRALVLGGGFSSWTGGAQINAHDGRPYAPSGFSTTQLFQTGLEMASQTLSFCNSGSIVFTLSLLSGRPHLGGLASYASNAAAVTAGLVQNDLYRRSDGTLALVL